MVTDAIGEMEEAQKHQWESCGCTVKCGRLKRCSEANVQESPSNTGVIIDTRRQTRRRYSQDIDRTDLIGSQCQSVSCEGSQSPMKFISPKIPKEVNNKQSTRAGYGGAHRGRRVLQDIEEADDSNDSNADRTQIQWTREEDSHEIQRAHDEREVDTTSDRITNDTTDIEAVSPQDNKETQMTSDKEPKEV